MGIIEQYTKESLDGYFEYIGDMGRKSLLSPMEYLEFRKNTIQEMKEGSLNIGTKQSFEQEIQTVSTIQTTSVQALCSPTKELSVKKTNNDVPKSYEYKEERAILPFADDTEDEENSLLSLLKSVDG